MFCENRTTIYILSGLEEFATPSSSVLNLVSELDESEETLLCHLGPGCPAYPLAPWIRKTAGFLGVTLYFMVLYTVQLVADCSPLLPPSLWRTRLSCSAHWRSSTRRRCTGQPRTPPTNLSPGGDKLAAWPGLAWPGLAWPGLAWPDQ